MLSRERGDTAPAARAYKKNYLYRFFDMQKPLD